MKKNKYILIGIPNCGKTTLGRRVADKLQLPFFDTDEMTCDRLKLQENPIRIFSMLFNGQFLAAQRDAVYELAELDDTALISTGAEVALQPDCAVLLQKMGTIIHIQRKPEIVLAGLQKSNSPGPVLRNISTGEDINMQEGSVKIYAEEYSRYEALADLTLKNNGSEDEGVEKLAMLIDLLYNKD
jgi:shikimate kinase